MRSSSTDAGPDAGAPARDAERTDGAGKLSTNGVAWVQRLIRVLEHHLQLTQQCRRTSLDGKLREIDRFK